MRNRIVIVFASLVLLLGCAHGDVSLRHDIAFSNDTERIAYRQAGKGEVALVFVHGWSCDSRYWQKQIAEFADDYQVIAIDLAGHGHSSFNRTEYTMSAFGKDVKAVLAQEEIDRAILIGHSMGGAVIAEAASLMPDRVIGIIGIDTLQDVSGRYPQSEIDGMVAPLEADFRHGTRHFVATMFPEGTDGRLIQWIQEDMASAPSDIAINAFRNYLNQYVDGEAAEVFKTLRIPVVSLNGRLWPTNLENNRKVMAHYDLFYIEETGHFPMLERPEAFNQRLQEVIGHIETLHASE